MKPINNKSVLHFLFGQMEKLDKNEIDTNKAKAQAALAKQVNNSLKYELDRAKLLVELDTHNRTCNTQFSIRNAEGINFD